MGTLRRVLTWLFSTDNPTTRAACPICGRIVTVASNRMGGTAETFSIPRPVSELTGACSLQHGTTHSAEEIQAARAEKPWR